MSIDIPIKVLHEAEGHTVTCETVNGEVYRGKLVEAEDSMNLQMTNLTVTHRDGRVSRMENVFIRGSKIRFLVLPDMLKNAPMFQKVKSQAKPTIVKSHVTRGRGRGRSVIAKRT